MPGIRVIVLAALAVVVAGGASARASGNGEELRVLFIGNSFTSTNDLPARLAELATATGRRMRARAIVFDGFSLEDHWKQGGAPAALASGEWDAVIMQQGPSSLPENQAHLRIWATRYAALARAAGTRPGLLAVGPESRRRTAFPAVIVSYRKAAEAAAADLYPAGEAWRAAWACDRRVALYGPDGLHPSRLGTYVAALVVYGRLFKAPLLASALTPDGVRGRTAHLLQAAAATALGRRLPPALRCG
ncbi:MAG: hypothetical protein H0U82_00400 [Actinobacteria bacterium]|nr:hypothetical protein [Actinomycetota bacterium]